MDDVSVAQFAEKHRPVEQLGDDGPQVLDLRYWGCPGQSARERRIDRDQPRVHGRIVLPRPQEPSRLHGLAAGNAHRGGDNRNVETRGHPMRRGQWSVVQGARRVAEQLIGILRRAGVAPGSQ